jgi:hypothetical protein
MSDNVRHFNASTASSAAAVNQAALQTVRQTTESVFAWQRELVRFATTRLKRDADFGQALATARTWTDAVKLQQDWAQAAIEDYTEETRRLMEIASSSAETLAKTGEETSRAVGGFAHEAARHGEHMAQSAAGTAVEIGGAATETVRAAASSATDTARAAQNAVRDMNEAARERAKRGRER